MKKITFLLLTLSVISSFAFEDVVILPQDFGVNIIKYTNEGNNTINIERMKKADKLKDAINNSQNSKVKFQFDSKQLLQQRTLDFVTRENNSTVVPKF